MITHQTTLLRKPQSHTRYLHSGPSEQIMFLVRRFVQNVDWILDLLSVIDKLLDNHADFTRFERLIIMEYLQFSLVNKGDEVYLRDRNGIRLDAGDLIHLRDQIMHQIETRAIFLLHNPKSHPLSRAFKQVLLKTGYQKLNAEERAILREAYLVEHNGLLYTTTGRQVERPDFKKRLLWKLIG